LPRGGRSTAPGALATGKIDDLKERFGLSQIVRV
jgi:hypothetical protein